MSGQAVSHVERHFIASNVLKRSRRYFDIPRLNHLEHQQQVERRMPLPAKQTIDSRLSESFVSSSQRLHTKVTHDIDFFHSKARDQQDETETAYTARTAKPKTVDMRKMLARSDYERERPLHRNEEQFNNYFQTTHRPRMSLDFQKHIGRKTLKGNEEDPEQLNSQKISKVYQRLLFDQSKYTCLVDYKRNDKWAPKALHDTSPSYEPARLAKANALTHRNPFPHQLEFYHGNGREDPSQLDTRLLKGNEYFWHGTKEERERLKDFAAGKRREDQQQKKVEEVLARHRPIDVREEMCDEKYFRRRH